MRARTRGSLRRAPRLRLGLIPNCTADRVAADDSITFTEFWNRVTPA
jgi:hypothetical protein